MRLEGPELPGPSGCLCPLGSLAHPGRGGEWWAIDGKSLGGVSAQERFSPKQNFQAVLSLYAHKRAIVLQSRAYENGKQSEVHLVQAMLQEMQQAELAGTGVTADALHCTKKRVS